MPQLDLYPLYFEAGELAAVLALTPSVVIKVYGQCQEENERQEQEEKKPCGGRKAGDRTCVWLKEVKCL